MNNDQAPEGAVDRSARQQTNGAEAAVCARHGGSAGFAGDVVGKERSKSRKAAAHANFAAGIEAWRGRTSPALGGSASTPHEESTRSGDSINGALNVGATSDSNKAVVVSDGLGGVSVDSSIASKTRLGAAFADLQEYGSISSQTSRPELVILVSDKVVEGAFAFTDDVIKTLAKIAELDDPILDLAAPSIRDVVAVVLGAESARVGLECQTLFYLRGGRVGRQWVMRVDPEFAGRLGDTSTIAYLTRFIGYVEDREIWSPKVDSIVAVGGIEARLISIARALRQAKVGGRQLGSSARLHCTEWQSPIEFPKLIGEGRPPQRETMKDEVVGHVTGDEWDERVLKVRPCGKKGKVPVSYVQAEGEDDQSALVNEAHGNRTQVYRATFTATLVDGKIDHRTLISLKPVQADLYPDTRG